MCHEQYNLALIQNSALMDSAHIGHLKRITVYAYTAEHSNKVQTATSVSAKADVYHAQLIVVRQQSVIRLAPRTWIADPGRLVLLHLALAVQLGESRMLLTPLARHLRVRESVRIVAGQAYLLPPM